MRVKKQQPELLERLEHGTMDWFQSGKGERQGCILSPCLLNLMQSSWEMWGWMKHQLESRLPGEISITSDMHMTLSYGRKWGGTKEPLDESERGVWKAGLKLNIQKTKIMASSPITSWEIDRETVETVTDFIFLCSKITVDGDCSHEVKRCLLLGRKAITNLDRILKSRDITLLTKVLLVKAMFVFFQ